jgi:hypothetical protein
VALRVLVDALLCGVSLAFAAARICQLPDGAAFYFYTWRAERPWE